jgi:hypothetical protein
VRVREATLEEPELKLPRGTALVDDHLRRNKVAKASHDKAWRAKQGASNSCGCRIRILQGNYLRARQVFRVQYHCMPQPAT